MIHKLLSVAAGLLLVAALFGGAAQPAESAARMEGAWMADSPNGDEVTFENTAPGAGWLLLGQKLYQTVDNGSSWQDITPTCLSAAAPLTVDFIDVNQGWALLQDPTDAQMRLCVTVDGGASWVLSMPETQTGVIDPADMPIESVRMHWLDAYHGWILFKQASSSNFSLGELWFTHDGGTSWQKGDAPSGEDLVFLSESFGFQKAHDRTDALYLTRDGGLSWSLFTAQQAAGEFGEAAQMQLPLRSGKQILLPVAAKGSGLLRWYALDEATQGWNLAFEVPLSPGYPLALLPLSLNADAQPTGWLALDVAAARSALPLEPSAGASEPTLLEVSSADGTNAWALWAASSCGDPALADLPEARACQARHYLLQSADQGSSWSQLALPGEYVNGLPSGMKGPEVLPESEAEQPGSVVYWVKRVTGHGFDACEIPTLEELQTWFNASPYQSVNLYIGGNSRSCANTALTANYLDQLYHQGWRFIPTWVGPQAPCTNFYHKFPYNSAEAYAAGVDNANQAAARLSTLGLTNPDGSGSAVYYDMEYFAADNACKTAVQSFLDGWTTRLHELNILSGLYGSSYNIYINQLYAVSPPPDLVWLASWSSPAYDPTQTVWNVSYLPDTYWSQHQRLHQYTGGHNETWGNVVLNIDCNVLDGVVTAPYGADLNAPVTSASLAGTMGISPWYITPVTLTLSASDTGTGLRATYYQVNGGAPQLYTAPVVFAHSGENEITYFSVDQVYNRESPKTISFKVDNEPPVNPKVTSAGCWAPDRLPQGKCSDPAFTWAGAYDAGMGLATVDPYEVYWGSNPNATSGTRMSATQLDPPPVPTNTPMYLRLRTLDRQGLWSSWQTLYTFIYNPKVQHYLFFNSAFNR